MEMLTFNDDIAVLGISTDGPFSHQRFIAENDLSYPLLTDEHKTVYDRYDMIEHTDEGGRDARRGVVLLDADRTVRYRWESESNWDDWEMTPLHEAYDIAQEYYKLDD